MKNPSRDLSKVIRYAITIVIGRSTAYQTYNSILPCCEYRLLCRFAYGCYRILRNNCPSFRPLPICVLISGLWVLISRVGRRSHFRTLRCCLMFRRSQLCNIHNSQINLCCWAGKISPINVWRVTSQTPHSNEGINISRRFILHNGPGGQF